MSIKVLAADVAAKIAAGEVVERPSSVVKELVENSLDAGATQITVEVRGAGIEYLRVTDNGCGMPGGDVELAFDRHATSKISTLSDLEAIGTLGFRGEALPSIAAVSRVSLITRPPDTPAGREVDLAWGEVVRSAPKGCPPGTSVSVENLFGNLPARRKFLKSPSGETTRVSDLVSRYALAFPEIQFRLSLDGRTTLTSAGNGILGDALASVYGGETAGGMLQASWDGDGYGARGFVSSPGLNRANRSYITFLVNRRWVQSPLLSFALAESYQGFLPERRHPVAVLNLTVPTADVDVNVHPSKREVRFREQDKVFSSLQRAVRASLTATSPVPGVRFAPGPRSGTGGQGRPGGLGQAFAASGGYGTQQGGLGLALPSAGLASPTPGRNMSYLRIMGQLRNTYLVGEGPDGLYLIDQHAAHERVLFERVSKEVSENVPQAQSLLEAAAVELSPGQEALVHANADFLERYGFVLEPFGERTYLLRAVPGVVKDSSPGKALVEVLDLMAHEGLLKERDIALAASIACHSSVRAGMSLSQEEMQELVQQLGSCENPHTCPHGRPTTIQLSAHHLEREFGRR